MEIPGTRNYEIHGKSRKGSKSKIHRSLNVYGMHGSNDENLRVTAVKTNLSGQQYTLIKLITKIEEKILEDEENILEQINQKKLE